jgi:hypothetical protein
MTDLIGDIHGHADALEALLKKLGYQKITASIRILSGKCCSSGDYIDRGLQIKRTLEIVRSMVESGNAIALMGNQ